MKHLIYILLFLLSVSVKAQKDHIDLDKQKIGKVKRQGKQALIDEDYYVALEYYKKLHEEKPDDIKTTYQLAKLYHNARDYQNAETYYQKVVDANNDEYAEAIYHLGVVQKNNQKYAEAKVTLSSLRRKLKFIEDKTIIRKYKAELAGIELQDSLSKKTSDTYLAVENLGTNVNGQHIESNPMLVDKQLYYTALKMDDKVYYKKKYDQQAGDVETPKRKFYVANQRKDGSWNTTGELQGGINSDEFDVSSGALSPNEDRFYFTRCAYDWRNKKICKIWVAERDGNGSWGTPSPLNDLINMPEYTSTHPTVGYDAKEGREVLYFVSDRPKGRGGLDIWAVSYDVKRERYLNPLNCGKVNSAGDEITPHYYSEDSLLYYSSNGHIGVGGFDVYYNKGIRNKWENKFPINVGTDINTSYDEQYFVPLGGMTKGFFTSNRIGSQELLSSTCCDDIYYFEEKEREKANLLVKSNYAEDQSCVEEYSLKVLKKTNNSADGFELFDEVEGVDCEISIDIKSNSDYKVILLKDGVPLDSSIVEVATGEEILPFLIRKPVGETVVVDTKKSIVEDTPKNKPVVTKEPISSQPLEVNTPKHTVIELPKEIITKEGEEYIVPTYAEALKGLILRDVYFDFDKATLKPRSIEVLDNILVKFMEQYPNAIVELVAHTDSYGSDAYNVVLSQKRAKVVRDYLVSKGVSPLRLLYYGRGEKQPIKSNTTDEGRSYNRRTEFRVLGGAGIDVQYSKEK